MRHLRPYLAVLAIAAIVTACAPAASSSGGESSQAAGESQPAASSGGGGGGGGGGGANGSITYEITGDYEASGELPFLAGGISQWVESANGWVANFANTSGEGAVILLNTQSGETLGQILSYGDGTITIAAASDAGSGMDCDFTLEKNDADGLKGHVDCPNAFGIDSTGAQKRVHLTADWDAHP